MDINLFPTKWNLILAKNSLRLANQGYELLDRKRQILIREMMELIDKAKEVQAHIDQTFKQAYEAVQAANIMQGISSVEQISYAIPEEKGIKIQMRSIMGVELPVVRLEKSEVKYNYGFYRTGSALDTAFFKFQLVKELIIELAEIENAIYRLAINITKTQKRVNALKKIKIPSFENIVKTIQDTLEEKEREEFARLKIIKKTH